jgi:hypothetical protein
MPCANCAGGGQGPLPIGRFCSTACQDAAGGTSLAAQLPQTIIPPFPDYYGTGSGVEAWVEDSALYRTGPGRYQTSELPQALSTDELMGGEENDARSSGLWDEQERRALTEMLLHTQSVATAGQQGPDLAARLKSPRPADALPPNTAAMTPMPDADVPDPAPPMPSDGIDNFLRVGLDLAAMALDAFIKSPSSVRGSSPVERPAASVDTGRGEPTRRLAKPSDDLQIDRPEGSDRTAPELRRTLCVNCVGQEARQGVYCTACAGMPADDKAAPHLRSPLVEVVAPDQGGISILESRGARDEYQFDAISASAMKERGVITGPLADLGEAHAYKRALSNGEIGLERPFGANRGGADFITAVFDATHGYVIVLTDAKWSAVEGHPSPQTWAPMTWLAQAQDAVDRVDLGDEGLNTLIKDAWERGELYLRQIDIDASPAGQMAILEHPMVRLS